jgi:hypothetical protein
MASLTIAQEEAKSPESPAKPSHGRHEDRAEERTGYRETDYRAWLLRTPSHRRFMDMTNAQQTTTSTAENRTSDKETSVNETRVTGERREVTETPK